MAWMNVFKPKQTDKQSTGNIIIVDRESICMGDDCTAPNEKTLQIQTTDTVLEVLQNVALLLPSMDHVVWTVEHAFGVLGYIEMHQINNRYELAIPDQTFLAMNIPQLHCRYFYEGCFSHNEEFTSGQTLLEKVKSHMKKQNVEEIKIRQGSLCIWGEWFGRPYDNIHRIIKARWTQREIILQFDEGETLYIQNPIQIENADNQFLIHDAAAIHFTWYPYGKPKTSENVHIRQYTKQEQGTDLRIEGKSMKQENVTHTRMHPKQSVALCIQ